MHIDRQQGFTLIELIMVIVILGILAATALPKFVDLSGDAQQAAVNSIAGTAGSAMSINYAGCLVTNHVPTGGKCVRVQNCNAVGNLMQGGLPSGYSVANTNLGPTNGASSTCTISITKNKKTYTAKFTGIAAGN